MTHNTIVNIEDYLALKRERVESNLETLLMSVESPYSGVIEAARYSLLAGGKRLRPILSIAAAEAFGCTDEVVMNAACALEMVHTYSLIHDDLPCMDDDDLRRGKPTLHKVVSEAHAVLAGDLLLTFAFEVLAKDCHLNDVQKLKLIALLSRSAGADGMIGGQVMDIEAEGKSIDLKTMKMVHRLKTGAMISAAVQFGGIAANVTESTLDCLKEYGFEMGLAFQIIDDVLDVTGSSENLGKTASSDIANDKATYVTLMGLEQAKKAAAESVIRAKEAIAPLRLQTHILEQIADIVLTRNH